MKRKTVYDAIDSERDYQDRLSRNVINKEDDASFSPITNLMIIEELLARARSDFYDYPGHPSMDYFRKIAAVSIRTMETFGVEKRKSQV